MRSALVLNATYEPLSVVPSRRAACLVLADKADIIEDDGTHLHAATLSVPNPVVIRLRYVVKVPYHRRTAMSRRAVFVRDEHCCNTAVKPPTRSITSCPGRAVASTSGRTSPQPAGRATSASETAHPTRPGCTWLGRHARRRSWPGSRCRSIGFRRPGSRTSHSPVDDAVAGPPRHRRRPTVPLPRTAQRAPTCNVLQGPDADPGARFVAARRVRRRRGCV